MKQLLLDLTTQPAQTLDSFESGQNLELVHVLHQFADRSSREHFAYLWGEVSAGKSHLLRALASGPASRYIAGASDTDPNAFVYTPGISLYLLDDCEKLSPELQIEAFALFNQIRENTGFMVSSGAVAPAVLPLREDLRTRMGWGLIYHVHGLSDADKIAALEHAAQSRGLTLSPGVLPYLLSHYRRDMRSLTGILDALDQYSLEKKRPMTLPLLRTLLNTQQSTQQSTQQNTQQNIQQEPSQLEPETHHDEPGTV
jgi:DnaA family protein